MTFILIFLYLLSQFFSKQCKLELRNKFPVRFELEIFMPQMPKCSEQLFYWLGHKDWIFRGNCLRVMIKSNNWQ